MVLQKHKEGTRQMVCGPTGPRTPVSRLVSSSSLKHSDFSFSAAPRFVSCYRWRSSLALQTVRAPLCLHFTQSSHERPWPLRLLFLCFLPVPEARKLSHGPSILFSDGLTSRWNALLRNPSLWEHRKAPNNSVCVCAMEKEASNCFLSKWGLHSSWKEFSSLRLLLPRSIEN